MRLRPYQSDAIDAVNAHLREKTAHAVVSIPTAGGKTVIFAAMIADWLQAWPGSRVCILAHRQELLTQAEAKMRAAWPAAPLGVWSAGLNRREGGADILIAGIQSIYRRACDLKPFDVVIIDEAHLVPNTSDAMYRRFLKDAKLCNPNVRYIGFTATPFRLDGGPLCAPGRLFDEVCYEADLVGLLDDGYLCPLRTKATETVLDAAGVHVRQGDYIAGELEAAVNTDPLVRAAVAEIVAKGADRKSWLIFCCGVAHAYAVSNELASYGIVAPVIVGGTHKEDRDNVHADFDAGRLRCVVNVNCWTTGLDVTRIDMIAVLRPTQSTALWVQMIGRGFRLHEGKGDCIVLDFGLNCRRHGPLDRLRIKTKGGDGTGEAPVKVCPSCDELMHAAMSECPACGYLFPPREINHEATPDTAPIIAGTEPWDETVTGITVSRHDKPGKPPSLCVRYVCGLNSYREWVCLEHDGFAGAKAARWWMRRFGKLIPASVHEAMSDLFLGHKLHEMTDSIRVKQAGKYQEITDITLKSKGPHAFAH